MSDRTNVINTRSFNNWGVQRGRALLVRVWGCPPVSKFPQDWGIQGVDEKRMISNLKDCTGQSPWNE